VDTHTYQAKDFIQTQEGFVFAVVEQGLEEGKVLCFLRYIPKGDAWVKVSTHEANAFLKQNAAQYLFYSKEKSAHLHAVSIHDIAIHHSPKNRLQQVLVKTRPDLIEQDCIALSRLLLEQGVSLDSMGVTGSLLIGAQNANSDIDLVIYGRENFHRIRECIKNLIAAQKLGALQDKDWLDSYARRSCDLSLQDYVWHEQRKFNKALINNRKFDLNLIEEAVESSSVLYTKQGEIVIQAQVVDVQYAFDYPARFLLKHEKISEVLCYTATYTGQAEKNEWIEVSGALEVGSDGCQRILVGSTREAKGQFIKVINAPE